MAEDDADDDERAPAGPPLPPDDRLWRHPSELGALGPMATRHPSTDPSRSPWPAALVGVAAGAALATSVLALTGALSPHVVERSVIEKVAVTPVVSSPFLPGDEEVADLVDRLAPAIVRIEVGRGGETELASGVVFRDDGLVLTAAHPLSGAERVVVVLADGRRFDGEVLGIDEVTDVAVVDVAADGLPVAVLAADAGLEVGDVVVALGADAQTDEPSIAPGMVTALQQWAKVHGGIVLHGLIESDGEVTEEQDGGPLVDTTGAVVGITTAGGGGDAHHSYAVPVEMAHRVAVRLLTDGHMVHAWLGVEALDLDADQRDALDLAGGAVVHSVAPGSPADGAGLRRGDVITHFDGEALHSVSSLVVALRDCDPGDAVRLTFLRTDAAHEAEIVVVSRPDGEP